MARNVNEVIASLPVARRHRIEKRAQLLLDEEMSLRELRRAREITQAQMAQTLGIAQKQISDIEKRTDMHISILRRSIEAMGGRLTLIAEFPNYKPILLSGLAELES